MCWLYVELHGGIRFVIYITFCSVDWDEIFQTVIRFQSLGLMRFPCVTMMTIQRGSIAGGILKQLRPASSFYLVSLESRRKIHNGPKYSSAIQSQKSSRCFFRGKSTFRTYHGRTSTLTSLRPLIMHELTHYKMFLTASNNNQLHSHCLCRLLDDNFADRL